MSPNEPRSRRRHPSGSGHGARTARRAGELRLRRFVVFAAAAALTLVLALNGGGYDIVVRQEVAMAVWVAIGAGLALGLLPRARLEPLAGVALAGLGGLALVTALALAWTESDGNTFAELARVTGYAGYAALIYLAVSRYTARAAAGGFAAAALAVPVLAIVSRLAPDLIEDDAAALLHIDRLSYPLGYWNAVAAWAAIATAIGLVFSAHAKQWAVRSAALAALPFAGLAAYLTYSRAGVFAMAIAVLAALALSRRRWTLAVNAGAVAAATGAAILAARDNPEIARATGDEGAAAVWLVLLAGAAACALVAAVTVRLDSLRMPRELARVAVAGVAVVGLIGVAVASQGPLGDAWDEFRNESAAAPSSDPATRLTTFGGSRYDVWSAALDAFHSDTARGVGPGSFEFYWAREGDQAEFLRDAHSLYFETLAELGVFGLLFLLLFFGGGLALALRARSRIVRSADLGACAAMIAAFAVFAAYAVVDWVWEMPALVALGIGGLAVAGAADAERWGRRRLLPGLRWGGVVVAVGIAALQAPGLVSTERIRASATALEEGDAPRALELADDAVAAESFAAAPYAQRARAYEALGELAAARDNLQEAARREPTNWRHPLLLARVAARQGDRREVRAQLAKAQRLSPDSPFLQPASESIVELDELLRRARRG